MSETRVPRRIQRKRTPGWRMPAGAIYVGRPSRWANPFRLEVPNNHPNAIGRARRVSVLLFVEWLRGLHPLYGQPPTVAEIQAALGGRDLACWCRLCERHRDGLPLGERCPDCDPCHVDPLLALANAPEAAS